MSEDEKFRDEYDRMVVDHIQRFGRHLVGVLPTVDQPDEIPFMYTVGNALKGLPELLILGIYDESLGGLMNWLSGKMLAGEVFTNGQMIDLGGRFPICAVLTTSEKTSEEYTCQVARYTGQDSYPVVQLVIPDKQGRYPWHQDCEQPYSLTPVLGDPPKILQ